MSQASNHLKWCLEKAKKEIKECKKLGKREKHRGLIETEPDMKDAQKHIEKAVHDLKAINYLLKGDFSDISASMVFYSMYHCFLAIAAKFGYESRNQTCTISLMEFLREQGKIDLDSKYIDMFRYAEQGQKKSVIDMREDLTYGVDLSADDKKKIIELVEDCKNLIDAAKEIIYNDTE